MWAQSYQGGVRGTVTDAQGAAVAAVNVTIIDSATSISHSTITSATGRYVFNALDPATYTVTAESPSFKKFERKNVIIGTQTFLTVDIKLEVGDVSQSVMVTEEVPLVENANARTTGR